MTDAGLRPATRELLRAAGLDPDDVVLVIQRAASEDLGSRGDITSAATIDADQVMSVQYVAREAGTVAGLPVLAAVFDICAGTTATLRLRLTDGAQLHPGAVIADATGDARTLLGLERLSLNLLGHLSGIATVTRAWVDAVSGSRAQVRDTRKTTPGLRDLEKYAVRCGGGVNHRRGLDDAVLIKDNHIAAAGGVSAAMARVGAAPEASSVGVQVEVDDLAQLDEALAAGAEQILLDNFSTGDLRRAVARVHDHGHEVRLEASGGLSLDRAAEVAETGVDFLAVGALTHSARSLDIGLDTAVN